MSDDNRPNREVVAEFRALLTSGFYVVTPFGEIMSEALTKSRLTETKPWRNDLWRAFAELERRLCPQPAPKQKDLFSHDKTD